MLIETSQKREKSSFKFSRTYATIILIGSLLLMTILIAISEFGIELPQHAGKVM